MLWDFSLATSLKALVRTWPFVLARMLVYGLVAMAYVLATGTGATVGWGLGALGEPGFRLAATVIGGAAGFGIVSLFLFLAREWFLYVLKAGHIAMLVAVLDGLPLPSGLAQLPTAARVVRARFIEANVLFVVDRMVMGVIRVVSGIVDVASTVVPVPGLARLVRAVLKVALGFVDEVILAYNIRIGSTNPFQTAQDALVLYAQNAGWILKNAIWLVLMVWSMTFLAFLVFLVPAAIALHLFPGPVANLGFVLAMVFALCLKAALLEPFAVASLIQVYFRAIEGQTPRADWRAHLDEVSSRFRGLGAAARSFAASPTDRPAAPARSDAA